MKLWNEVERKTEEDELTDLGHVQKYFQIHQQFIDIPVEDYQLSLAQGESPVRVRRGDHTVLAGPKETVAGQLHVQCQAGEKKETIREQSPSKHPGKSIPLPERWILPRAPGCRQGCLSPSNNAEVPPAAGGSLGLWPG